MHMLVQEAKRFSKYGTVGLFSNFCLYGLFLILIQFGISPVLASGISYVIGVALSYLLNRQWTYQSKNSHARDLPKFLVAYGVGFVTALVMIAWLIRWFSPAFAQIINMIVVAVVIYTLLNLFKFGVEGHEQDD